MPPIVAAHNEPIELTKALPELAARLERGETVELLDNGRPVGKASPTEPAKPAPEQLNAAQEAFRELMELGRKIRAEGGGITLEELIEWKNEGRP